MVPIYSAVNTLTYHAALTHGKCSDDGQGRRCESHFLRQHLKEVRHPWLAQRGCEDTINVDDRVGNHQL